MAVSIESGDDRLVPEEVLDDLRVRTGLEQDGGCCVPKVVVVPTSAQSRLCRPPRYADLRAESAMSELRES